MPGPKKDVTSYNIITDVGRAIPDDACGEDLKFQYVFPTINGIAHPEWAAYRFMRSSNKRLKPQLGGAQADLMTMGLLIREMAQKRNDLEVLSLFK